MPQEPDDPRDPAQAVRLDQPAPDVLVIADAALPDPAAEAAAGLDAPQESADADAALPKNPPDDLVQDTDNPALSPSAEPGADTDPVLPDAISRPDMPPPVPRPRPICAAALFGKLPTRGDFIARNMPRALQRPFEDWLIPLVQQVRTDLGANWSTIWRGAGPWRFWIGAEVFGSAWHRDMRKSAHDQTGSATAQSIGAMTGVILPSADRHGRDFPLVLLLADPVARLLPPPVTTSPDRGWYDMCDEVLYAARAGAEIATIEAALDQFPGPILPEGAQDMDALLVQQALWAQGTDTRADGTSQIWPDIARADHHLAASHRSYWWQAPRAGAAQRVLTLGGLPDAGSFAFMLSQGYPETLSHRSDGGSGALLTPDPSP